MILAHRPIDVWPGVRSRSHADSNFSASYATTLSLLDRELEMLRAQHVVLMIDVDERDLRIDGQIRADARPATPGVILAFDSKYGALKYACDRFTRWQDNVRAIALGLEALRRVERYGITTRGEQYTGWKALPGATAMGAPMSHEEAARVLVDLAGQGWYGGDFDDQVQMLLDDAPGLVEDAYRWAVKLHHPDRGGDPDLLRRATEARDVLGARA